MNTPLHSTTRVSDADLIAELTRLVACERKATADLLRSLMEFDVRRLYLSEGYPSLFAYCTKALHYAEHAALNRIEVARAARRPPSLLEQHAAPFAGGVRSVGRPDPCLRDQHRTHLSRK